MFYFKIILCVIDHDNPDKNPVIVLDQRFVLLLNQRNSGEWFVKLFTRFLSFKPNSVKF